MVEVGVFGLGLVGMALARRLIAAGVDVGGFDPAPDRQALLREAGGTPVEAADVWRAPTVLSAVFDGAQLAGIIDAAPGRTGALLVSLSTLDPEEMPDLAARAAARDILLVEACVSGSSKQLGEGTATLLLGGEALALDRLEPLLPLMAGKWFRVGGIGDGNRAKLAINLILGLNRAAVAEGLVFAEALGLDLPAFLDVARQSAAQSQAMEQKGELMVTGAFAPLGRIDQSHKDFSLIRKAAAARGLAALPFAEAYLAMMEDGLASGEGGLDNSAIIKAIARTARGTG